MACAEPQSSQAAPAIPPQPNQEPVEVADQQRVVATSPASRSRTRAPSAETAPAIAAPRASRGRASNISNKIIGSKTSDLKRSRSAPAGPAKGTQGAVAPGTLQSLPDQLNPRSRSSLPYKAPPLRPPKPDRPAPSPPERPFKAHPIGIEKVRSPVGASSPGPPPLDADERARREADEVAAAAAEAPPRASGESSGSGLAPHVRGRPLPEQSPTFSAEGSAGHRPRHHGPELQPPRLVSKVVELETDNIRMCVDWHDTETTNGRNFHFRHLTNL